MPSPRHSFVIPIFNEEEVLPELFKRFDSSVGQYLRTKSEDYELILVDDGSKDRSRALIAELHRQQPKHVKLIALSRNFGHQIAITGHDRHRYGDSFEDVLGIVLV